jgi:hypothetical protein
MRIQQLDADMAAEALTIPAGLEDAQWDNETIDLVVDASGRYPYFLQQFGQETWHVAAGAVIARHDAALGVAYGINDLDNGLFRVRWDRATRTEQSYLRAMASDRDEGSPSSDVAMRLSRKPASLGPTRASLVAKGLIYARRSMGSSRSRSPGRPRPSAGKSTAEAARPVRNARLALIQRSRTTTASGPLAAEAAVLSEGGRAAMRSSPRTIRGASFCGRPAGRGRSLSSPVRRFAFEFSERRRLPSAC